LLRLGVGGQRLRCGREEEGFEMYTYFGTFTLFLYFYHTLSVTMF
jgi:hypothetical protein